VFRIQNRYAMLGEMALTEGEYLQRGDRVDESVSALGAEASSAMPLLGCRVRRSGGWRL
jgi:hypothetical protein